MWNYVSHSLGRSRDKYPPSPGAPSSRLLRQVSQSRSDQTAEEELCDGETPLYIEFSLTSDGLVKVLKNVIDDVEDTVNQKTALSNTPVNIGQFQLCNWANVKAPPTTPIKGEANFRPSNDDTDAGTCKVPCSCRWSIRDRKQH